MHNARYILDPLRPKVRFFPATRSLSCTELACPVDPRLGIRKHSDISVVVKKLQKSRRKVLQLADFIIPGHAGMYKVK
ncbi:hypothetical protein COY65_03135 [Candidatus Jorgensenbacteria bacterium CG_4_10_14_0_8_um_filter_39_13]|uniref:Uncharacterized protein n=1 Tax=Candidatus Jorgensenbacteria bacterium CG_4_10_14_0_8_um_filter_39_13 TaxID=1974589 RepID=A0A2M7RFG4_9BACT|nr:MAG: hypothetical protein COS46_02720 [Candidatus Jorgensenbacteria bacterium CG03_land_8_20_14_0_80_38_39]PIY95479.1 MAG: hypothetical protein COY65_03135 [Candidatus Jorgensenbacteria bacterium CG_4_10_14_0_8_um_filter_39_13]